MAMLVSNGRVYPLLVTPRLRLRPWREPDLAPFAALNADRRVMEFLPKLLNRAESDALALSIRDHFAQHGFGLWVVELPGMTNFIGFVGLSVPGFTAPFTPCVEVGWRLAHEHWGHGYATEAAGAAWPLASTNSPSTRLCPSRPRPTGDQDGSWSVSP